MSEEVMDKYEEPYMGASIENQHLQAGLIQRLTQSGKCEIIS